MGSKKRLAMRGEVAQANNDATNNSPTIGHFVHGINLVGGKKWCVLIEAEAPDDAIEKVCHMPEDEFGKLPVVEDPVKLRQIRTKQGLIHA